MRRAPTEKLDRTVAEMGKKHRTDVPQGENADDVVQHQAPPAFETPVEFVPIDPEHRRHDDHVSKEVSPFADEVGGAETRDDEGAVWHPGVDQDRAAQIAADRGMDVDLVHDGSVPEWPVDDSNVEFRE